MPPCARDWPDWKSGHAAEKSSAARLENQMRQLAARRQNLARELERMAIERARLLGDNIELDQRAAELAQQSGEAVSAVEQLAAAETEGRATLAGARRFAEDAAHRSPSRARNVDRKSNWSWSRSRPS